MKIKNLIPVFFACLFFQISVFSQQSMTAKVVGIVDGDTITVMMKDKSQKTIQIKGIDAPELEQSFGKEARQKLTELLIDKNIIVEYLRLHSNGEIFGKVFLANKDVALEMLKSGFAWVDGDQEDFLSDTDKIEYISLRNKAKNESVGLWQQKDAQSPSEFRKNYTPIINTQSATVINSRNFEGQVAEVTDGSTIILAMQNGSRQSVCIKYLEIPEPEQAKADIAEQHLKDLLLQKNVRVKVSGFSEDEYCLIADVYINDININLQMVRDGVAWVKSDYYYPEGYYTFKAAEDAAKSERRGIWEDPANPIMPSWEYRDKYYPKIVRSSPNIGYGDVGNVTIYSRSRTEPVRGNGPVQVRGYTRADGTYVRPHTRRLPNRTTTRVGGTTTVRRRRGN